MWSRAAGSAGVDRGLGLAIDADGAVYDAVSFRGTVSFGGEPLSATGTDYAGAVIKYSP